MAKVKKAFFCIEDKKSYKVGDTYNGKRTDLKDYLIETEKVESKPKRSKKVK